MKSFFEFNEHEYYGIVVVEDGAHDDSVDSVIKAVNIYVEAIADDNPGQVLREGEPVEISRDYAFWQFANCEEVRDYSVHQLLQAFQKVSDACLLIDSSLI